MTHYVMKNMMIDLVDNSASVCITCDGGKGPTVINLKFPMHMSADQSEHDLRLQARDKVRLVLTRALESMAAEE